MAGAARRSTARIPASWSIPASQSGLARQALTAAVMVCDSQAATR